MKKIFLLAFALLMLYSNCDIQAHIQTTKVKYNCYTNGSVKFTEHPLPGMDQWTYDDVYTITYHNVRENGDFYSAVHNTSCFNAGDENCRVQFGMQQPVSNELGEHLLTADYMDNSYNFLCDYVEEVTKKDPTETSGSYSNNEILNGLKIYRSISWNTTESGELIKTVFINIVE